MMDTAVTAPSSPARVLGQELRARLSRSARRLLHRPPAHPLLAANHASCAHQDLDRRLKDCRFVVLDSELTGLNPRADEVVSLAAVRLQGLSICPGETFSTLVQPRRGLPKASTLIHRITPGQVAGMPRLRHVLPDLLEFLDGSLVVGHHIGLDMAFLNRACLTVFGDTLANPCLDTMRMARILRAQSWESSFERYDQRISYTLEDLAAEFGLPRFPAHDALGDAMQTAYLFLVLVKKLSGGGIRTLRDLYEAGRSWRWYM